MEQTFETPGPLTLRIDVPSGEIALEAVAGATRTDVELEGLDDDSRRAVEESRVELRDHPGGGHELVVEVPQRKGWGGLLSFGRQGYRLRIRCPEAARALVQSKSATVRGSGRFGDVDVMTASGDIAFDEIAGDAQAKSASGDVELGWTHGRAAANSVSGDVALGIVEGPLTAQSVSGDVAVVDARGSASVNTVSGDQRLDAVREGAVQAQSVSGDVLVGVRRGSRIFLDCNTMSGDTSSELELTGQPVSDEGPLVEIRAKTVSGDIRIVRAAAFPEEVSA